MKQFYFLSGLPRSGSTLLSSILNQNPQFYASPNSPMCGMMVNLERSILASEQYNAWPKPHVIPKVVCGLLENYYSDIDKPYIMDKSRVWSTKENFGTLLRNLPYDPKVILTVRSINEILASFMYMIHQNPQSISFIDQEIEALQQFFYYRHPDEIRCDHLMRPKGMIDECLYGIAYAMLEENRKYFHLVEYDNLINSPQETLDGIYQFLNIDNYSHDFNNIINIVPEDDKIYGLPGLHDIRPELRNRRINIAEHLSPYIINKYNGLEFWRYIETTL